LECLVAGQYDPAAAALGRAVELAAEDSQKAVALFYRSRALALAGQTESALQAAHEAHRLQPDSPRIRTQPAWVEYYGKRYSAAIEQYEELLDELGDQYESAELRDVVRDMRLALSNLYLLQEDRPRAEECLEQVLDEFPDDIGALNDLGYLWTEEGKYLGRALTMIQAAVEGEPENSAYRDSLGWAYYRLGRFAEAVTELEKACQDEQTDGVILDHLGDAYLSLDRVDQAIAAWERAVKAFADEEDVARRKATQEKIRKHRDAVRAGE
jgi:tetratricopeptide (TPR) repeat protein